MAIFTNITTGPKGGYLNGQLVMVEAGQSAELDDAPDDWFEEDGAKPKRGRKAEGHAADDQDAAAE